MKTVKHRENKNVRANDDDANATIARLTRERDEASQTAERFRASMYAVEERALALTKERDEARAGLQWMVERAADGDGKLDGYRELGAKAAAAEEQRDLATAEVGRLKAAIDDAHAHATASVEAVRRWMLDPHQESPIHLMAARSRLIVERLTTRTPTPKEM